MEDSDVIPTGGEQARSVYWYYLVAVGSSYLIAILQDVAGIGAGAHNAVPLILGIVGLVQAYRFRRKADEPVTAHFRLQIRSFWIYLLYSIVCFLGLVIFLHLLPLGLVVFFSLLPDMEYEIAVGYLAGIPPNLWLAVRCVKGLRRLARQEPYPNPGTWLW